MEFSEEEATSYVHRDKNKEINVLEWIALVIQEPLQVAQTSDHAPLSIYHISISYLGCRSDRLFPERWGEDLPANEQDKAIINQQAGDSDGNN